MMKRILVFPVLAIGLVVAPVSAQSTTAAAAPSAAAAPAVNTGVASAGRLWEQLIGYMSRAAEQMPEADYAFKPTPEVRSFGQMIGHVAGAQYLVCGAALNEPTGSEDDIEKSTTAKADLVAALKASTDYCRRAYAQSDTDAAAGTKLFGMDVNRMYALMLNATHVGEHYGNIVTYMRIKGMVPPSSQPRPTQ